MVHADNKSIFRDFKDGQYSAIVQNEDFLFTASNSAERDDARLSRLQDPDPRQIREITLQEQQRADSIRQRLLIVGLAALYAFLQANATGPPLDGPAADGDAWPSKGHKRSINLKLSVDGAAIYHLTPFVKLFSIAAELLNHEEIQELGLPAVWARLRVNLWHQKLLSEESPSLRRKIYADLSRLDERLLQSSNCSHDLKTRYLLERAAVNIHYGNDERAREDLELAARNQHFEFILTGRLGKRTKFQRNDLSQLVVLAKSADSRIESDVKQQNSLEEALDLHRDAPDSRQQPKNLRLEDDTLLDFISFTKSSNKAASAPSDDIPASLAQLDPAQQPILNPLDSIILLSLASTITNTSPEHGLTREETLPYANRVLEGGSSNWQIYTQALLVRSRIEAHRSRTVERSVLQLQTLVDQVIAATTNDGSNPTPASASETSITTFLPTVQASDSAPGAERLQYVHQLSPPFRWSLEAELASQWIAIGGLRTAVEIYERLEMWAEAALCWAATDMEDKARESLRQQLHLPDIPAGAIAVPAEAIPEIPVEDEEELPADAPRLLCILGDVESNPAFYERAWKVSKERYARAQRSLGKHYMAKKDLDKASEAYAKSLRIEPQNAGAWFTLGCAHLARKDWASSVDAFSRTVKIEPEDAEAWSNLGAALAQLPREQVQPGSELEGDGSGAGPTREKSRNHAREALVAFKRAAGLKRDSFQIWQNILNIAAAIAPPPYADAIIAQKRLIELRGSVEGEACVDVEIMQGILSHVIASAAPATSSAGKNEDSSEGNETDSTRGHGLNRVFADLVVNDIKPLITHSRDLWQLVARLALHLSQPGLALDAYEKAWRIATSLPGWDDRLGGGSEGTTGDAWTTVVDATVELVDAYESLGEREITEGLGAGSGQLVCKKWRFKARMALKSVIGKRDKAGLGGSEVLEQRLQDLHSR